MLSHTAQLTPDVRMRLTPDARSMLIDLEMTAYTVACMLQEGKATIIDLRRLAIKVNETLGYIPGAK